jgi:hypothetical protein
MIGEWLYQLNPKDAAGQAVLQRVHQRVTNSQAAATVAVASAAVPQDVVFVVTQMTTAYTPGGAQTVTNVEVAGPESNPVPGDFIRTLQAAGAARHYDSRQVSILLMPGEQLTAIGTFSAGASANVVTMVLHGFYLPRGNLQLRG